MTNLRIHFIADDWGEALCSWAAVVRSFSLRIFGWTDSASLAGSLACPLFDVLWVTFRRGDTTGRGMRARPCRGHGLPKAEGRPIAGY